MIRSLFAAALCLALLATPSHAKQVSSSAKVAVEDLLSADNRFADAARTSGLIDGLAAMVDPEAVIPAPDAKFARGRDGMVAVLTINPKNVGSRITWAPVRAGLSADGTRGFTFGYATVTRADGTTEFNKYLSYWVKRKQGWRVLAYQRVRRQAGPAAVEVMEPILPVRMVKAYPKRRHAEQDRGSLAAAEKAFSDLAQQVGLGPTFGIVGTDDAVLISIGNEFVIGAKRIAKEGFDASTKSQVAWASDGTDVASSGDLGLSWGVVRPNPGAEGEPFSFFTIWHRDNRRQIWRFIAE